MLSNKERSRILGPENIKTYHKVKIEDMIVQYGDHSYGVVLAYNHFKEGIKSLTPDKPLDVLYILEENKFLLIDGYHRYVANLLAEKKEIMCRVNWLGYSLLYDIPAKERFIISEHKQLIFK